MPMPDQQPDNPFIRALLPGVFARTALPVILIMSINGVFVLVDAWFISVYAGPVALSAVTRIFPAMMLLLALQTLVSNGMASILARHLGAGDRARAAATFSGAHVLSAVIAFIVMILYFGWAARYFGLAGGSDPAAVMAGQFLAVVVATAPIAFLLSINVDALRSEGRIRVMTAITIGSTLLNILFNWLLLGVFEFGVAGSAAGSALAQTLCLAMVLVYRHAGNGLLRLARPEVSRDWGRMVALGLPMSLGFIGISLASAAVIHNVSIWHAGNPVPTLVAYGVITRILTFAYLPLLGINIAFQTVIGNNIGARLPLRVNQTIRIGLLAAFAYTGSVEAILFATAPVIGAIFVDDPAAIAEIGRILPMTAGLYLLAGPVVILSGFFQALGDAPKAAVMGLSKSWLFAIPLAFLLPPVLGEPGIWLASPASEIGMTVLALLVLAINRRQRGWSMGLFAGDRPTA